MSLSEVAEWGLLLADVLLAAIALLIALVGLVGFFYGRAWAKSQIVDLTVKETRKVLDEAGIKQMIKDRVDFESQGLYGDLARSPDHPDYELKEKTDD